MSTDFPDPIDVASPLAKSKSYLSLRRDWKDGGCVMAPILNQLKVPSASSTAQPKKSPA
ncbi:MAG: hypothetical protein P1U77_09920 [Rubripirellula sp.]|nr:hypothetical protein [Rubripirellula sp.]